MRAKRVYVLPILLLYVIGLVSCKDWGEVDPPAGNQQIGEAKETVAEFTFETLDMFAMELGTYEGGAKPELVRDEKFQSNVLHLNGGYIGMDNPLIGKTIENGVSVSLWTKMSAGTITRNGGQEEQNETSEVPADSNGALLSFTNDSESFVIMQDGSVLFRNESIMTGVQGLSDGEWHYWTLSIGGGYISLYADGSKKAESELSADAYGSLSVFLTAGASNMYIGYGSTTRPSEMWVEDLKFVNGVISEDEVEVPVTGIIVVGATDFSTGFGGAYSQVWTVENNTVFKCRFKNYSNMEQNWFNYILGISNGLKPGDEGYKNYAYIRADNYGWIDDKNDNTHLAASSCTYNWETLRDDLNGATVDLKFTRRGNSGLVETVIITADGRKLTMNSAVRNLSADANVGVFFTVDHSYLEIEGASISREPLKWQEGQVGNSDNSSLKNSHITDVLTLVPESEAVIKFKNYTSGLAAADNWMLALSNGKTPGQAEYSEYALLRADNWGWLNGNDQETLQKNVCEPSNNYLLGEGWSEFIKYMDGADVTLTVRRINNKVSVKADIITEAGVEYNYFWKYSGLPQSGNVGLFLTVNNSYLQVSKNEAKEKSEGTVDNRLGDTGFMTGWWQAFTPVQKLDGNGTVTYKFVNHSNRIATWNNWALGVSNGNAVGETGYSEYVVLRADNYGWKQGVEMWPEFTTPESTVPLYHLIDGANVTLTVKRNGADLEINAEYKATDGQTYTYGGTLENVVPADGEIGTFLTVDGAYLTDITSQVDVEEPEEPVGPELPETVYFNDFENTTNNGCTIRGGGSYQNQGDIWGQVYQNGGGAQRTHYLQLPADVLSHSAETKEMTVAFWVNAKNAIGYEWSPIFAAYAAAPFWGTVTDDTGTYEMFLNTSPMFACQSRGLIQINCYGWCDFTPAQNKNDYNTQYNGIADENNNIKAGEKWFADNNWHYYTVVLTETNAKVYLDGEIKNEWNVSGQGDGNIISGLFTNGAELTYVCLGGNQAWAWRDNDAAFMFDDFAVYNKALTQEQIEQLISNKQTQN